MIKPLTSLRFFFAFMVFLHHYVIAGKPIFAEGYIGVSFFFILSGFILSYSYKERLSSGKVSKGGFWIARFARIYPLHLLTLLVAIVLLHPQIQAIGANLFLVQSFIPERTIYFSCNSVSWSISDEMFFYLLFPVILFLFSKAAPRIKIGCFAGILILYFALVLTTPDTYHHALFYVNPLFRLLDFVIGILLFETWEKIHPLSPKNGYSPSPFFSRVAVATVIEMLAIGLLAFCISQADTIPDVYRYGSYYWIPMALIIYIFAQPGEGRPRGYISRLLSWKPLVICGEISFGFYMIHQLAIQISNAAFAKMGLVPGELSRFILIFGLILTASVLSFHFFETPVNRWIKKQYQKYNERRSTR